MLSENLFVTTLQRVEDVLEDFDAVDWELKRIVSNPNLPWYQIPEAKQKVALAREALSQAILCVQEILTPFAEEWAALKIAQEAAHKLASREPSTKETGHVKHASSLSQKVKRKGKRQQKQNTPTLSMRGCPSFSKRTRRKPRLVQKNREISQHRDAVS